MTSGQQAGLGVPQVRAIRSSWFGSEFAWKMGFLVKSSPKMQPQLHTSIEGP